MYTNGHKIIFGLGSVVNNHYGYAIHMWQTFYNYVTALDTLLYMLYE